MEEKAIYRLIDQIRSLKEGNKTSDLKKVLKEIHPVDISDAISQLSVGEKTQIIRLLDNDLSAAVLLELDEEERKEILDKLSPKEIASEIIIEIESDDAADLVGELKGKRQREVIAEIESNSSEYAEDIVDLLQFPEDTAGGIMGKELVSVNQEWSVIRTVREMRRQAEGLNEVYSVYVVDDKEKLLGALGLKKLLTSPTNTRIKELYKPEINFVKTNDSLEEVANFFQRYDMFEAPVVDELGRLAGKITVDDVIDFMREEADKDYQLASGISNTVDPTDGVWDMVKARLPWLLIGVFGGVLGSLILKSNEQEMSVVPMLVLFVPLIAATAGNVGVQSSAIVVQALANGSLKGLSSKNLLKEMGLAIISGFVLAGVIFLYNIVFNHDQIDYFKASITISTALFVVVLVSATIGTVVPLLLFKRGVDPAIATGPFITTSNDLLGIIIYFFLAKFILGI